MCWISLEIGIAYWSASNCMEPCFTEYGMDVLNVDLRIHLMA